MSPILTNFVFLSLGMFIGFASGWSFKSMQYAREARNNSEEIRRHLDEQGWLRNRVALSAVLLITAVAAIWTGIVNDHLQKSQSCSEKAVSALVSALEDRTNLTTEVSKADLNQNHSFSILMGAVLSSPPLPKSEVRRIFEEYYTKLNAYLELQEQQRQNQLANPLPKDANYRECLSK